MSGRLGVDTDGLRSGAARSGELASSLSPRSSATSGNQPSHAGVSAILAAADAVRARQSERVSGQADTLRSGAGEHDRTESRSVADIAKAM